MIKDEGPIPNGRRMNRKTAKARSGRLNQLGGQGLFMYEPRAEMRQRIRLKQSTSRTEGHDGDEGKADAIVLDDTCTKRKAEHRSAQSGIVIDKDRQSSYKTRRIAINPCKGEVRKPFTQSSQDEVCLHGTAAKRKRTQTHDGQFRTSGSNNVDQQAQYDPREGSDRTHRLESRVIVFRIRRGEMHAASRILDYQNGIASSSAKDT